MLLLAFLSLNKKQAGGNGQVGLNALVGEILCPPSAYIPLPCSRIRFKRPRAAKRADVAKHTNGAKHQDDS